MKVIVEISNLKTWPKELVGFLDVHFEILKSWQLKSERNPFGYPVQTYDQAVDDLRGVLNNYFLSGYHCTRLTANEIEQIKKDGMALPNKEMIHKRIESLVRAGHLNSEQANTLKSKNQAHEKNRQNRIWFCFYAPKLAGESRIIRLLRSWGGEALYNSHERDPQMGPILRQIGSPTIIKALIPISSLANHSSLEWKIINTYLRSKSIRCDKSDHDDSSVKPIASDNILDIISFPSTEFINLTGCNQWKEKLTSYS